jgi:hypothetical protein
MTADDAKNRLAPTRGAGDPACGIGTAGHNDVMRAMLFIGGLLAAVVALGAPASADPVGVVKESGRTAGHAVRDGAQTFGRTTRDFFLHGPRTARHTWNANAARTRMDAHHDKARVKAEAHDER